MGLWDEQSCSAWAGALRRYDAAVAAQGVPRLVDLDRWYHGELPALLAARRPPFLRRDELVRIVEWKMARGVWRPRNLQLVRSNAPEAVEQASRAALARAPEIAGPIARLAELRGVGPATASAVLAAAWPEHYPFLDEAVAAQLPQLGRPEFTARYYARYAAALRERATALAASCPAVGWSAHRVDLALWAAVGGKAGRSE